MILDSTAIDLGVDAAAVAETMEVADAKQPTQQGKTSDDHIQAQHCMFGDPRKIAIVGEQARALAQAKLCDQTVDHAAHGDTLAAAVAVEGGSRIPIRIVGAHAGERVERTGDPGQHGIVAHAAQHFETHYIGQADHLVRKQRQTQSIYVRPMHRRVRGKEINPR